MQSNQKNKKKLQLDIHKAFQAAAPYLNMAYVMIGSILILGYLGHYFDKKLHTSPFLLLFCVFLGFGLSIYNMIKVIKENERK